MSRSANLMEITTRSAQELSGHFKRGPIAGLAIFLSICAIVFMLLHVFHVSGRVLGFTDGLGIVASERFRLDIEQSYSEHFEFAALMTASVLFLVTAARTHQAAFFLFAIFAFVAGLDGFFEGHEAAGSQISRAGFGVGEFLFFLAAGLVSLFVLMIALTKTPRIYLGWAIIGIIPFALLGFFAAGVDAVHDFVDWGWRMDVAFAFVEDAGELVAIVGIVLYAVLLTYHWFSHAPR